jgi:hypothetical protein
MSHPRGAPAGASLPAAAGGARRRRVRCDWRSRRGWWRLLGCAAQPGLTTGDGTADRVPRLDASHGLLSFPGPRPEAPGGGYPSRSLSPVPGQGMHHAAAAGDTALLHAAVPGGPALRDRMNDDAGRRNQRANQPDSAA